MAPVPLLTITSLTSPSYASSPPLWSSLSFSLLPSSILVLRGPSGSGKSVLLKSLASLLVYPPPGEVRLRGQTACEMGVPEWRSRVIYIPQRTAMLPGTPAEFWKTVMGFASKQGKEVGDPREVAEGWGIGRGMWEQSWGSLSGGEAQRIALAVGVALRPEVLLLDEPTSSLDAVSTALVEATLLAPDKQGKRQACIWATHSDEQAKRVADATLVIGKWVETGGASGE